MSAFALKPNTLTFTVLLGLLAALPPLSIDINQPTLLAVERQFHAPSQLVGLTLTVFMLGFALGQFAAGPMSDRHGRRPMLLGSLTLYTAATVGCGLAASAGMLVTFRMVQGVAAGACAVLAFAMIRDLFVGDAARAKRSYVTVVISVAPMLAPTLGAWILEFWGWRPIFALLAIAGTLLLAAVTLGVAESRAAVLDSARPRHMLAAYGSVLADHRFLGFAGVNALSFGVIFAYIAGSPEVLMGNLHLTPYGYGAFFASTAAALTAGAWASGKGATHGVPPRRLLLLSLSISAIASVVLATLIGMQAGSLMVLSPLLLLHMFCRGLIAPNAQHLALEPMHEQAGTAAAVVGVMQILTGAVASGAVAGLLPYVGSSGMTLVMASLALGALGLWLRMSRLEKVAA